MTTWPFRPNWASPYVEQFAFMTEIIDSDSGREQRRALRVNARHSVEYEAVFARDRMRTLRLWAHRQSDPLVFADEVRSVFTTQSAAADATTLSVDAAPAWLPLAEHLVVEVPGSRERIGVPVASVTGTTVTLGDVVGKSLPAGSAVHLGVLGRLAPKASVSFRTNTIAEGSVEWMVEPGQEVQPLGSAPVMFNGREVLLHRPNWATPLDFEVNDPITFVDPGMGVRAAFRLPTWLPEGRRSSHLVRSDADLNQTLGAFLRARGRQGEFYQPTFTDDLPLQAPVATGSNFWRIRGHEVFDAYGPAGLHKAFAVVLVNGDIHLFRVVELSKGGTIDPYTLIQAVETAPAGVTPASVAMICWMPVVRFASDEIAVQWRTDRIAEIVMNTLTLEDLS